METDPGNLQRSLEFAISSQPAQGAASPLYAGIYDWLWALIQEWGIEQVVAHKQLIINAALAVARKLGVANDQVLLAVESMLSMLIDSLRRLEELR